MTAPVSEKRAALLATARERILVLDGAMGTMIQGLQYDEAAFRGARFADFHRDVRGNNDLLILTQPKAIEDIHADYLRTGAIARFSPVMQSVRRFADGGGPLRLTCRRCRSRPGPASGPW